MKKVILVSNQLVDECFVFLKPFGLDESNKNRKYFDSIDNIWKQIQNDYENKNNKPIWETNALLLIDFSLIDDTFILNDYQIVNFEDVDQYKNNVDYKHFNGYLVE